MDFLEGIQVVGPRGLEPRTDGLKDRSTEYVSLSITVTYRHLDSESNDQVTDSSHPANPA